MKYETHHVTSDYGTTDNLTHETVSGSSTPAAFHCKNPLSNQSLFIEPNLANGLTEIDLRSERGVES